MTFAKSTRTQSLSFYIEKLLLRIPYLQNDCFSDWKRYNRGNPDEHNRCFSNSTSGLSEFCTSRIIACLIGKQFSEKSTRAQLLSFYIEKLVLRIPCRQNHCLSDWKSGVWEIQSSTIVASLIRKVASVNSVLADSLLFYLEK